MQKALSFLPVVLQYIPLVETGVENLISWVDGVRAAAQQANVWTDLQEQQYLASLRAWKDDPAWQPDKTT